jgi:predicted MPP superfamily phosphohydrolase
MPQASHAPPTSLPPKNAAVRAVGKRPRMSRFLRVLIAVTALVHVPFVGAVGYAATRLGWPSPWALAWSSGAAGVLAFVGRGKAGSVDTRRGALGPLLFDVPYFVHWCACVWCLFPSLGSLLVFPFVEMARHEPLSWPLRFYFWTYASGLVVCAYGVLVRRRWFVTKRIEVPIRGLDPKLDGYRIAQLSDLHIGTMTPRHVAERWVRRANQEAPDLAVVTGDMVTSGTAFHEDIAAVIGELRAKDGVFVCMGNHDYFGDGEPLISLLRARGVRVLRNEGTVLARGDAAFYLAGIDDTWTRRDDMAAALRARPRGMPAVLLAHDPDRFPQAAEHGVELTLSGHTHGGQIAFPFLDRWISASHIAHRYNVGTYRKGDAWLYVHPGLGTTGPPMRLGVAPAVVIVTLRAA